MLIGRNDNIAHKGKVYHVQTEDSGPNRPHIITLLYYGGNIISSKKTSYADIVNSEFMEDVVRGLMDEQHAQMIKALKSGAFDKPGVQPEEKTVDAVVINAPVSEEKQKE